VQLVDAFLEDVGGQVLAMWAEENNFDAPGAVWGITGRVAAVCLVDGLSIGLGSVT